MLTPPVSPPRSILLRPSGLALFGLALVMAGFLVTFVADEGALVGGTLISAIANTAAIAVSALPVWWLCGRMQWRHGDRWWFLPVHVICALLFAVLWIVSLAIALGIGSGLSGDGWRPAFLQGPALHWLALTSIFVYFAIGAACYAVQASRDAQRSAETLHHAQLHALRAQLDPHLLFNTLHSLLELVRSGDSRADDAIDRFARVARYVAQGRTPVDDLVELRDEWAMAQDYVALEALRLGSRLQCTFACDDSLLSVRVPALSLQPLIENAITHGISARPGPGRIDVTARRVDDTIALRVEDDGLGVLAKTHGAGTGLELVRRRLATRYGARSHFTAGPRSDGTGWSVDATFPVRAS
jgi:signal transduction histidine kinase